MEKDLIDYFDAMSKAFPYQDLEKIYSKYIKESIEDDAKKVLDPILNVLNTKLKVKVAGHLTTIYVSGSAEMMDWGGLPFEGIPSPEAISWAEKHAAKLVTQMDEETKNRLAQVISDGIANKRGPGGLATDIKRELGWMGRSRPSEIPGKTMQSRASLIARTETADALGQAFEDRGKEMDTEGKEWVTVGDNKVSDGCLENEAAGVIPFNDAFPSGHMRPPRFPGCRCACAPARLNK
jgi:SPP1 gp7 family putative phage head morphogenesis protein